MPIFKFKCTQCEHEESRIAKYDETEKVCMKCKGLAKKVFSAGSAAVKVNGKGAYTNKMRV